MNENDEGILRRLAELKATNPPSHLDTMSMLARAILELRDRHDKLVESVIANP